MTLTPDDFAQVFHVAWTNANIGAFDDYRARARKEHEHKTFARMYEERGNPHRQGQECGTHVGDFLWPLVTQVENFREMQKAVDVICTTD